MTSCTEEVKTKILAEVVAWVKEAEGSGLTAKELQTKLTQFYMQLAQRHGASLVREVLRAINDKITGPLN